MTELQAHFNKEIERWFANRGDHTHRINYALDENSIVVDLGGYKGDWADKIHSMYKCSVYVFEPVKSFFYNIKNRFASNPKIQVFNAGIGPANGELAINVNGDASSTFSGTGTTENVEIWGAESLFKTSGPINRETIDLIKINIEGGEYDLLDFILEQECASKFKNIQVQFHTFMPDCEKRRDAIRSGLQRTHKLTYNYDFVWENWERI